MKTTIHISPYSYVVDSEAEIKIGCYVYDKEDLSVRRVVKIRQDGKLQYEGINFILVNPKCCIRVVEANDPKLIEYGVPELKEPTQQECSGCDNHFVNEEHCPICRVYDVQSESLSQIKATTPENFPNQCGEGDNRCNCKSESECGYVEMLKHPSVPDLVIAVNRMGTVKDRILKESLEQDVNDMNVANTPNLQEQGEAETVERIKTAKDWLSNCITQWTIIDMHYGGDKKPEDLTDEQILGLYNIYGSQPNTQSKERLFTMEEMAQLMVVQISLPETFTERGAFNREKFDKYIANLK